MRRKKTGAVVVLIVVAMALLIVSGVSWWFYKNTKPIVTTTPIETSEQSTEPQATPTVPETAPTFDVVALQATIDAWTRMITSDASVVAMDVEGNILASSNADERYFTASLYKLFVAYEGYKAVDAGQLQADENFQGTRSVSECLDLMIRESDSPCGERMWVELGKSTIDTAIKQYGINSTDMIGLQTTAKDTATMLARIARAEGLTAKSAEAYMDSMKDQPAIYRRGLPSGFSSAVTVYNKVGWNEQLEWHDGSIIERADGTRLVLAVLTKSVGSKKIAELATAIESVIVR